MAGEPTFDDVIADRPPEIAELATGVRALIHELDPAVVEVPWPLALCSRNFVGTVAVSNVYVRNCERE